MKYTIHGLLKGTIVSVNLSNCFGVGILFGCFSAGSSYSSLLSRCNNIALSFTDRKELTKQPPVISTDELKNLLELTRECFWNLCNTTLPKPVLQKAVNKTSSYTVTAGKYHSSFSFNVISYILAVLY